MADKPHRLVILLQDLEFGGTQRYVTHLLRRLDRRLFSPELWVLRGGIDMLPTIRETGVRTLWLSKSARVFPWALIKLLLWLLRKRPQVLYSLTVVPNIWGRIFGKLVHVPTMVSGYRNLLPKQYEKLLWPLSKRIICNADILKDIMTDRLGVSPERIAVIPNGVDTDIFVPTDGPDKSEPTILFVGRLVKDKDPINLLRGFVRVVQKIPSARLEIVGNGPLRKKLLSAIRKLSLEFRVRISPGTQDIRPHLRKASIFVLPAYTGEGSPNVIIEAMAAGLPVVATRVGGNPELVVDGKTGFIVNPGDPRALSEAMIDILVDDKKRKIMGKKARERVLLKYNVEDMVRKTEQVLLAAIHEN